MKYFVFSIDDGTIYDETTIGLFNKYGVRGTFNLNSGLDDFVWYLGEQPIRRFNLYEHRDLYKDQEVASHTLTHPYLDQMSREDILREVNEDIYNLENIFQREVTGFATPFHTAGEREVEIIRDGTKIRHLRLSDLDESFKRPIDQYHIKCTSFRVQRALELFDSFINDPNAELFVFVGHSYDFFVDQTFDKLEILLQKINEHKDEIKVLTMQEMVNELF